MGTMTQQTHPHALFHVARLPNGSFQVMDGLMRIHLASDEAALGLLIAELVADPDIPRPEMAPPRNDVVRVGSQLLSKFFPHLGRLVTAAEPLVEESFALAKRRQKSPSRQRVRSRKTD
jgi:hypothetical protein